MFYPSAEEQRPDPRPRGKPETTFFPEEKVLGDLDAEVAQPDAVDFAVEVVPA